MGKKPFYKTKEFLKERRKWYAKAKKAGFQDHEYVDWKTGKTGGEVYDIPSKQYDHKEINGEVVYKVRGSAGYLKMPNRTAAFLAIQAGHADWSDAVLAWYWYRKNTGQIDSRLDPMFDVALYGVPPTRAFKNDLRLWWKEMALMQKHLTEHGAIPYVDPPCE